MTGGNSLDSSEAVLRYSEIGNVVKLPKQVTELVVGEGPAVLTRTGSGGSSQLAGGR